MKILIASDHAGFELKTKVIKKLNYEWQDLGPKNEDRVDYPDYADALARKIKPGQFGVLICGSGQGMSIRANKYPHIRAALCWSKESAELARRHNDANVICLGSRLQSEESILEILGVFFKSPFDGGRHADRVKKMSQSIKTVSAKLKKKTQSANKNQKKRSVKKK